MIIEHMLIVFLLFYLLQISVMVFSVRRLRDFKDPSLHPLVSVVIAARNEEQHLAACLESVLRQSYDPALFEVVVVNDHSSDKTEEICSRFEANNTNVRHINAKESSRLRGKTNALDQGIAEARGEIILITDADCTVPPTWIASTAQRFASGVGIVGGLTIQRATNWFGGMQSLDWVFLLGLAASTISLRVPLSTIGNNLSFMKSAYYGVSGYQNLTFSVTEDFVLFQAIVKTRVWDYLCPIDPEVLVTSQPCENWRDLLRQKHRWGKGGLDMRLSGLMVMVVGFGYNALLVLSLLSGGFGWFLGGLGFKAAADYTFLRAVLRRLQRLELLRYFAAFEIYFITYVLLLPFVVFFGGRVVWKGRSY